MSAQHTPGPWIVTADVGAHVIRGAEVMHETATGSQYPYRDYVASTWGGENEANARLIAAAPELLEALREVLDMCAIGDVDEDTEALGWGEAIKAARAAIAKATGEAA